jgi:DNA-binding MarR family transcriptional regulator
MASPTFQRWVDKQADLSSSEKSVLRVLVDLFNEEWGYACPSQKRIASLTSYSDRTIRRALSSLETKQKIQRRKISSKNGFQRTIYNVLTENRTLWSQKEHLQQADTMSYAPDTVSYPPDIMSYAPDTMSDYILSKSYNPLLNKEGTSQNNFNKGGIKEFRYWTPQDFVSASEKARNSFLRNYQYKFNDWLSDFLLVKEPGGEWVAAQSSPVQLNQVIDIRKYSR